MKTFMLLIFTVLLLAPSAFAASRAELKKVQKEIQNIVAAQPGVNGIGITECTAHELLIAAGLAVPAVALPPELGIAIYFSDEYDMHKFALKVVNEELKLPKALYCPMVIGEIKAE